MGGTPGGGGAMASDGEITRLLLQAETGRPEQLSAVFEQLYPELRKLAASTLRGHESTFSPTVLVHELYLRLTTSQPLSLTSRRHFFAAAAKAMRWIVVDQARRHNADKRGGGVAHVTLSERLVADTESSEVLALHEGLDALDLINPRQREVVELHYFAGIDFAELGELLQCSERTVRREWTRARAVLYAQLAEA